VTYYDSLLKILKPAMKWIKELLDFIVGLFKSVREIMLIIMKRMRE